MIQQTQIQTGARSVMHMSRFNGAGIMLFCIEIGQRVAILRDQSATRFGPPKYPGRTGTVVRRNPNGGEHHNGLWYVQLDATSRAKPRIEPFWGKEFISPISKSGSHHVS